MKHSIRWLSILLIALILAGCQQTDPGFDSISRPGYWNDHILQTIPTIPPSTGPTIDIPTLPTISGQTYPTATTRPVIRPTTRPATQAPTGPAAPPDIGQGGDGRLSYTKYGRFTGQYPEDGKDEHIENIAAVFVTNVSAEYLEYADIRFNVDNNEAVFIVTGLQPGASTWVVEKNKLKIPKDATMTLTHEDLTFNPDNQDAAADIHVELKSGYLQVYNNTGRKIKNVYVYYKRLYSEDCYLGGITYRVLAGTLANGETKDKINATHCTPEGCRVVRITWD